MVGGCPAARCLAAQQTRPMAAVGRGRDGEGEEGGVQTRVNAERYGRKRRKRRNGACKRVAERSQPRQENGMAAARGGERERQLESYMPAGACGRRARESRNVKQERDEEVGKMQTTTHCTLVRVHPE